MIYGWRSVKTKTTEDKIECEKCNKEKTVSFDVYQEYMHVMWVPLFPMSKHSISQCAACGDIQDKQTFSENYKKASAIAKKQAGLPLWTFIGIPVIAVLIYLLYFTGNRKQ